MFAYELPLDPPIDNYERVETLMQEAFEIYLKRGHVKGIFQDIYDMVFEEIENNLYKYQPEAEYDGNF